MGFVDGSLGNKQPLMFSDDGFRWCLSDVKLDELVFIGAFFFPGKKMSYKILNEQINANVEKGSFTTCLSLNIGKSNEDNAVEHGEKHYRSIVQRFLEERKSVEK